MNSQRLSKLIATREQKRITNHLLEVYSCLTPSQRKTIKIMLNKKS